MQDRNIERQIKQLEEYGCEKIFIDKSSGKDLNRTEYKKMKSFARDSDTIVFVELDRLGRNKDEINQEWDYFINKNIDIVVLDMPILDTTKYIKNPLKIYRHIGANNRLRRIVP